MPATVDYYFAPQSPWTYLGHARLVALLQASGAQVRLLPMDLGPVFAASGGLPLGKRPPQRQAYRLVELQRYSQHLGLPMVVQPRYFPVSGDDAARLVIAVDQQDGSAADLRLAGAIFTAVWAQERDIASSQTLAELLHESGVPLTRLEQSRSPEVQQQYEANTRQAINGNIFGAPTYVVDGEMFWGQDRLDFVERKLAGA